VAVRQPEPEVAEPEPEPEVAVRQPEPERYAMGMARWGDAAEMQLQGEPSEAPDLESIPAEASEEETPAAEAPAEIESVFAGVFASTLDGEPTAVSDHSGASPDEPDASPIEAAQPEIEDAVVAAPSEAVPPPPTGEDRYDDVWAAAFPQPDTDANGLVDEAAGSPEQTPAPETTDSREVEPSTGGQPSSEGEPVAAEASSGPDAPDAPSDEVSVDDDLWALRARLAHAGDSDVSSQAPPAPSWE
jgi:hypothetical protein